MGSGCLNGWPSIFEPKPDEGASSKTFSIFTLFILMPGAGLSSLLSSIVEPNLSEGFPPLLSSSSIDVPNLSEG